jgi:amino acid adenylation domain-containing protein
MSNQLASIILAEGVSPTDRIGIFVPKSLASVVSIFGALSAGVCYVPLDPEAPVNRLRYIIRDADLTMILTNSEKAPIAQRLFEDSPLQQCILVDPDVMTNAVEAESSSALDSRFTGWKTVLANEGSLERMPLALETDTAYILYTSGSTGTPKGVMISHRNSLTFVTWAASNAGLNSVDRVACHAPLHFDISTFSIFSSVLTGAEVVMIPDRVSMFPSQLAKLIDQEGITVWYSVPSVLTLLALYGDLKSHNLSRLRTIVFAGEVFPVKHLRMLMDQLPRARYLNWYGPTETNVCTWYEVPKLNPQRTTEIPIGKACENTEVFAVDDKGKKVLKIGQRGELYVRGPSVMQGYWRDPDKTRKVLIPNPFNSNHIELVYKTGDIVTLDSDDNFNYLGREDGMVKTRGYRVELGEIESVIYSHKAIKEVVVVPIADEILGNRLCAVVSLHEGSTLSKEELMNYCGQSLPRYMIPDSVEFRKKLPNTSTGKIDRVGLARSILGKGTAD